MRICVLDEIAHVLANEGAEGTIEIRANVKNFVLLLGRSDVAGPSLQDDGTAVVDLCGVRVRLVLDGAV